MAPHHHHKLKFAICSFFMSLVNVSAMKMVKKCFCILPGTDLSSPLSLVLPSTFCFLPLDSPSHITPEVNFMKVGRLVQIIEIALSIYVQRLCPTFEKLFTGVRVLGAKKVYEIDPKSCLQKAFNKFKIYNIKQIQLLILNNNRTACLKLGSIS